MLHPSACRPGRPPPASPRCPARAPHVLHPCAWCTWAVRAPSWFPGVSCSVVVDAGAVRPHPTPLPHHTEQLNGRGKRGSGRGQASFLKGGGDILGKTHPPQKKLLTGEKIKFDLATPWRTHPPPPPCNLIIIYDAWSWCSALCVGGGGGGRGCGVLDLHQHALARHGPSPPNLTDVFHNTTVRSTRRGTSITTNATRRQTMKMMGNAHNVAHGPSGQALVVTAAG